MSTLRAVQHFILLLLGVTAVSMSLAFAEPIPVGGIPEQGLFITYYEYSLSAPIPFQHVTVTMNFAGWDPGEIMMFDFFDGQQGEGLLRSVEDMGGGTERVFDFDWTAAKLLDGQFSIGFRLLDGAAELTSTYALVNGLFGVPGVVTPAGSPYIIPEPGTLLLLGIGVAGIALLRREVRPRAMPARARLM